MAALCDYSPSEEHSSEGQDDPTLTVLGYGCSYKFTTCLHHYNYKVRGNSVFNEIANCRWELGGCGD